MPDETEIASCLPAVANHERGGGAHTAPGVVGLDGPAGLARDAATAADMTTETEAETKAEIETKSETKSEIEAETKTGLTAVALTGNRDMAEDRTRVGCGSCGRTFAPSVIVRHEPVCTKSKAGAPRAAWALALT